MKKSDFYFDLPEELIAQTPLERRDASRLLTLDKTTGAVAHHHFYELPQFLRPNDCLVLNDSRVLPARLLGNRSTGGAVEVLLLRDKGDGVWECLTKPGRKTHTGTELSFGDGELTATVVGEVDDGNKLVQFHYKGIFLEVLERLGQMPLPPYIKAELQDPERYQTVYSREVGSAAAPTAGLHFTSERLCCCADSRPSFYEGAAGEAASAGRESRLRDAPCGTRHVPPRKGRGDHGPSYAQRVLHDERPNGKASQRNASKRPPHRLRRHNILPDSRIARGTRRHVP